MDYDEPSPIGSPQASPPRVEREYEPTSPERGYDHDHIHLPPRTTDLIATTEYAPGVPDLSDSRDFIKSTRRHQGKYRRTDLRDDKYKTHFESMRRANPGMLEKGSKAFAKMILDEHDMS